MSKITLEAIDLRSTQCLGNKKLTQNNLTVRHILLKLLHLKNKEISFGNPGKNT